MINLSKKLGIDVEEKHIKLDFLKGCDEAFLTGTAVEITPISKIADYNFSKRDITKLLISEFKNYVANI